MILNRQYDVKLHRCQATSNSAVALVDVTQHHDPMSLASRVKEARQLRGIGMNELDRLVGQSSGYTTRLESGSKKMPSAEVMNRLASALRVHLSWLLTGQEPRELALEQDAPSQRAVVYDDQYPARADAVAAARALKTISEEAITQVQSICYKHEGASLITAEEWLDKMRAAQRDLDRGLVAPRMAPGEVDPLDEEPPINKLLEGKKRKGKK